jgi:MFS family permease
MKNSVLIKKMIPIFLSSFVAWFYCMTYTPLGYMFNSFPGMDAQVMLIATLPGIVAMVGGFAAGGLMNFMSKKLLVIVSMVLMIVGGFMVRFLGSTNITIAIIGSGMTGFAAGSIPAANYTVLAAIAPQSLRDKVCGWSDSLCMVGIMFVSLMGGFLAADGNWARAYNIYYIVLAILVLDIFWYPSEKSLSKVAEVKVEDNSVQVESNLPKPVIAVIVVKFFAALFYMSMSLFMSDYIINELQIGTSALVGTLSTIGSLICVLGSALVFAWLKIFKSSSTLVAEQFLGVAMLIAVVFKSVIGIAIAFVVLNIGMNSHHSSYGTIVAMAPKGKAVGLASGLFIGATFVGEALNAYVVPFISNLIFGDTLASHNILVGGVGCIVLGFISFPIFKKAYKIAFPEPEDTIKAS